MRLRQRNIIGVFVAIIGFVIALAEFFFRWYFEVRLRQHYDISLWPILFGGAVAFVGGSIVNIKFAEEVGGNLVGYGTRIISVVRTGKRSDDPVVVVASNDPVKPRTPAAPEKPADTVPPAAGAIDKDKGE